MNDDNIYNEIKKSIHLCFCKNEWNKQTLIVQVIIQNIEILNTPPPSQIHTQSTVLLR